MSTTIPPNNNTGLYSNLGRQPAAANVDYSTTGNITAGGYISATGNISTANSLTGNAIYTNNYFYANGQPFTGSTSNYGNGNVVSLMAAFGSNVISTTGNITAGYVLGNGSQLTGLPATYGNANVTTLLASFGSNTISTTGNVTAGYVLGNGSQLTGLPATYSNANVTTLLASFGSNSISTTGNILAGTVSATGNITAAYILGNGSQLTGLPSGYSNANVAAYLPTYSGNIGNSSGPIALVGSQANIYSNDWILLQTTTPTADGIRLATTNANATITLDTRNLQLGNNTIVPTLIQFGANANINFNLANATGANLLTSTTVSATGNITGGNIITAGTVSATGNITGNYFIGNGSLLTGIATGSYSNSNVVTLLASFGSNTISTTGNITAGNLISTNLIISGSETDSGNITGGNLLTGGKVSAVGNITGNYFIGNGSQLTGIATGSYSNSNVVTLLASFGSNTISTSGNITAGNLSVTGIETDTGNITGGNILTGGQISAVAAVYGGSFNTTGQVTANYVISGSVTYANTDGSAGQVLTTYGNGHTYFSTVSGNGGGSPGGSNTQIQYNNGGAFAGNSAMTFDNTTGNVTLGNIVSTTAAYGPQLLSALGPMNPANVSLIVPDTGRITLGTGYNGNLANTAGYYSPVSTGTTAAGGLSTRLFITDNINLAPNVRTTGQTIQNYFNLVGNITTAQTNTRINGLLNNHIIGGGSAGNIWSQPANSTIGLSGIAQNLYVGGGTTGNLVALGNTTIPAALGVSTSIICNLGSNILSSYGYVATVTQNNSGSIYGNIGNAVGYITSFSGSSGNANVIQTTTAVGYYHPGIGTNNLVGGFATGNIARMATNYYAFYNEDTLAKTALGSLSSFNEYTGNITSSSGSLAVNKNNGQVQQVYLTENITSVSFSNFVTRVQKPNASYANQSDTVTLIIQQGATPYSVTMPSGTGYKYAGGSNTVGTTANATTMISITGTYNYNISATEYLITISPEFS